MNAVSLICLDISCQFVWLVWMREKVVCVDFNVGISSLAIPEENRMQSINIHLHPR